MLGFGPPAYLYVGVDDVHAAIDFYERAFGAEFVWHFRRFGTEVAAVRVSREGPQVLLAEHRPTPSCLPCCSGSRSWVSSPRPPPAS